MVVWGHFVQAQAISDIRISPDGVAVLYLKDSDSLFLQDLSKDSSSRQFLASGLKQNFNQRFLKWSPNARHFMWEYNQQLFLYDVLAEQASSIDLRALRLGMYFRIDQVALSNDGKVFFSGASEEEAYFGLYKGNFRTGTYELLSAPEGHVANISLSPDQNLLGYSVYRYLNDQYHASMHLMNPESKMPLGESTWYPNCFFQGLSFSDAGALMARNVLGRAYVFELPELEDFLEEVAAPEPEGVYFLQFKGDDILSLEQTDGLWSYSLRKASGELIKSLGRRESNEKWYWQAYPQQWMSYEDGVHPKTLFEFQGGKKVEIYSFAQNNPLEETPFSIVEYTNGAEKKSEAFVYGEGSKGLIILPYGGYSNRYPKLDYFLNQLAFPLLDQGFVLAFLNTRGYANQKLGKNYGVVQLEDTELFLDFWQAQPGQAGKPVFLLGHSHGATMVYYYLTHSQRFAGGIAINGASDWIGQARLQRMTGLPGEMGGTPEQDAALYQEASPLEQIAKNMPPVLIVSGALDTQIPAGINALAFYKKARKKRVKARQLHFADQGHLILGKAAMAELQEEVKKFLKKYSR
jgi:dipeptidyl aminopeptidase/acylaminoacyl peptidase